MSNDALERIKQRQRASVPARDEALVSEKIDTSVSSHLDTKISVIPDNVRLISLETKSPEAVNYIRTKQTTMRLEAKMSERLAIICRKNDIGREVFLEALFEHYELNPEVWGKILEEAKSKAGQRQHLANFKRAQSMMQKFE